MNNLKHHLKAIYMIFIGLFMPITGYSQDNTRSVVMIDRIGHKGMMEMPQEFRPPNALQPESLQFEPYQMIEDLTNRNDLVFLMRHGPTDWSKRDVRGVASTDCVNQRIMTEEGKRQMQDLGLLLSLVQLVPGEIVVSEWCRNQQTLSALTEGINSLNPAFANSIPITTDPSVNLLLSLGGAENVTALRDRVLSWEGDDTGPLLIITHYTNIQELTEFSVYEGEILVLDPKLNGRVLGYLRLASAAPDIGHFDPAVVSD